jgi:hypothetical protein
VGNESGNILSTSPLIGALAAQVLGTVLALLLFYFIMPEVLRSPLLAALIQGGCAAIASHKLRAPSWWQAINLLFAPLVVAAHSLDFPPGVWLGGFGLLLLVFWRTDRSRVPLYLSNARTAGALMTLLPAKPCYVLDAGCGDGGLLRHLAKTRPDCEFVGIEHAPLPWLWARLGATGQSNLHIRYGNFWKQPLTPFDLVYAFLSPTPMPEFWVKSVDEMRPDSLLVSNSFAVPEVEPEQIIEVGDRRATRLYCYRPGNRDQ